MKPEPVNLPEIFERMHQLPAKTTNDAPYTVNRYEIFEDKCDGKAPRKRFDTAHWRSAVNRCNVLGISSGNAPMFGDNTPIRFFVIDLEDANKLIYEITSYPAAR